MKYRVHTYQTIRVSYEVEADSADAAKELVEDEGFEMTPVYVGSTEEGAEWTNDYIVDPLFPDGSVDYENVKNYIAPTWRESK